MKILISKQLVVITLVIIAVTSLFANNNKDTLIKVERPASLPSLLLFPDYKTKIYYNEDNQFELSEEDYKRIFVIAEYLIKNPDRSVYLEAYMHENEEKETALKRNSFIRDKMTEIGVKGNRVLGKTHRPWIPQDTSDIFTPEELKEAKKVTLKIIR